MIYKKLVFFLCSIVFIKVVILTPAFCQIKKSIDKQKIDVDSKLDSLLEIGEYEQLLFLIKSKSNNELDLSKHVLKLKALNRLEKHTEVGTYIDSLLKKYPNSFEILLQHSHHLLSIGRAELALEALEKASLLNEQKPDLLIELNTQFALSHFVLGNEELALDYIQIALQIATKNKNLSAKKMAALYNNTGLIYSNIDPKISKDYYQKAFELNTKIYNERPNPALGISYTNLAIAHKKLDDYALSIDYFDKALSYYTKYYPENNAIFGFIYLNIADVFVLRKNYKKAEEFFKKAESKYINAYGLKHPDLANLFNQMANLYLIQNQYYTALDMVNKSILSNIELSNLPTSVSTKSAIHPQIFLNSLLSKSDILYNLYQNKTLKRKHLTAALALLFQCDTLVDALRKIKTNSADKLALGSLSERVYESGVQLSLALADVSLSSKKYNELAFYFNEKSKAAILLEAIADTKAKGFAGLPDYVLLKEQNLKSDLSYLEQQLAKAIPGTEIYYNLKAKYKSVDDEYQNFIKKLEVEYPSYYQLKYSQKIVSVSDLQAKLNKKEALISYLEAKDKTYIFEISKSNLRITEKEKTEQVEKNIKGLRNSILHQDTELYSDLGFQLFKQYAEPIIKYEHVVLIPSGRLASIPFETLLTSKIKRKTLLKDYPYLIKKTAVSSQFSASIFLQNYSNNITTTDIKALVCAPISFSSHTQYALSELPGTKSEAAALTQLFTKNNISTDQVLSENVTETWIKSTDLNKYNYLHLATHGTVDENKPELSQIFLVKDKQNDGNLYSGEIFNLKLNARLVTLSACQTGLGKIAKGEGMIGLSRSLLYAGAQNMVVSLWTVNDSSTSQLMNSFYTHLLNDKNTDLSKALRIAKLEMINSDGFSAPYFWAPFVLVGR